MAGLGIVDDSLFESELNKMNDSPIPVIKPINRGRGEGSVEVPNSLRQIIGDNVLEEGRAPTKELTEFLGISDSSLSAYSKGATSTATYNKPDPKLGSFLTNRRRSIAKKASAKLLEAMEELSTEKLQASSARELSGVMKDMSAIVKDMLPEEKSASTEINNQVQFVMFAPALAKESKFDAITVNE